MTAGTPLVDDDELAPSEPSAARARDAGNTRQLLLQAARLRFARDGYAATTVRDISTDAGVNVALINRYFTSKEGLFEACIAHAAEELGRADDEGTTVDRILQGILNNLPDSSTEFPLQLLLLMRSSGDERADRIRRDILESFARRMALAVGGEDPDDTLVLRAQIVLSTALGIILLRSSTGIEPLTSASASDLEAPLGSLLAALLSR